MSKACKWKLEYTNISTQLVPGIKRPGREAEKHQRQSINMKEEPLVTAATERIAAVVGDSCALTFC